MLLQECPESPYFARDDFETTFELARNLVLEFVERSRFGSRQPLPEASQSNEQSSLASASIANHRMKASLSEAYIGIKSED